MEHRVLNLLDVQGLQDRAAFNKEYLHLGGASSEVARYFNLLEIEQRDGSQTSSRANE